MKMMYKTLAAAAGLALAGSVALADEIHDKTMVADRDLKEAVNILHLMGAQHGPDFGGHFQRAEELARAADKERDAGMRYFRAHHPGWQ